MNFCSSIQNVNYFSALDRFLSYRQIEMHGLQNKTGKKCMQTLPYNTSIPSISCIRHCTIWILVLKSIRSLKTQKSKLYCAASAFLVTLSNSSIFTKCIKSKTIKFDTFQRNIQVSLFNTSQGHLMKHVCKDWISSTDVTKIKPCCGLNQQLSKHQSITHSPSFPAGQGQELEEKKNNEVELMG